MHAPKTVELCEVGPRDGFQFEKTPISTEQKLQTIRSLLDAGLTRIQATSFVHPRMVPQMADAEELLSGLPRDHRITALALNMRGLERAIDSGVHTVDLSIALNEQHASDVHEDKCTTAADAHDIRELPDIAQSDSRADGCENKCET